MKSISVFTLKEMSIKIKFFKKAFETLIRLAICITELIKRI